MSPYDHHPHGLAALGLILAALAVMLGIAVLLMMFVSPLWGPLALVVIVIVVLTMVF